MLIFTPPHVKNGNYKPLSCKKLSVTLDIAKVIVTILVVVGHVAGYARPGSRIPQQITSEGITLIYNLIYSFHMPAFFALSGAVFFITKDLLGKYDSMKNLCRNKFRRLMIPYIFFISLVLIPLFYLLDISDIPNPLTALIAKNLFIGEPAWLWFLPALFIIFVIFQLLHKHLSRYKIIIFAILTACFVLSYVIGSYVHGVKFQLPYNVLRHMLFFYFGYLAASWLLTKRVPMKLLLLSIPLFFCLIALKWFWINKIPYLPILFDYFIALCGIVGLFAVSYYLTFSTRLLSSSSYNLLKAHSFGIYLIHCVPIFICAYILQSYAVPPLIFFMGVTVVSFACSLPISMVMSRKPYLCNAIGLKKTLVKET